MCTCTCGCVHVPAESKTLGLFKELWVNQEEQPDVLVLGVGEEETCTGTTVGIEPGTF